MEVSDIVLGSHVFIVASGIYKVREFKEMYGINYLVLDTVDSKNTSTVFVPTNNKEQMDRICEIKTKEEMDKLSKACTLTPLPWNDNRRERQAEFNDILHSNNLNDVILMIKCLTNRNEELKESNKRLSSIDSEILAKARYLIISLITYAYKVDKFKAETMLEEKLA